MSNRVAQEFFVRRSPGRALIRAIAETLEPRLLLAAFGPVGVEFRVNTTTNGLQTLPAIATDADGDTVVVWNGNGPGDAHGIFAQRLAADGNPLGAEFRVSPAIAGQQYGDPAVAMDADGDFVITWQSLREVGQGAYDIHAQRYSAAGEPIGSEFGVNTTFTQTNFSPSIAMDANGDFVIAWAGYTAGYDYDIYARRFSQTGAPIGGDFPVNTVTANDQLNPSAAMDATGDFVIAWQSQGQDSSSWGVYAQRYDAQGSPNKDPFKVNSRTTGAQLSPSVAMSAAGSFVVAWQSAAQDGSGYGVYAQRYVANGAASGSETRINSFTTNDQRNPSVSMDANGDYLIAWESDAQDKYGFGIYARRFSAAGTATSEFRANKTVLENQLASSVAMDAAGDAIITWASYLQDGSNYGIYAQRYDEDGDAAASMITGVTLDKTPLLQGKRVSSPASQLVVAFSENLATAGGVTGANSPTNPANWGLTRNGADISSQITSISFGFNSLSHKYETTLTFIAPLIGDADYVLTARQALQDLSGNSLDGDLNGTAGGDFVVSFPMIEIVNVGPETQLNTLRNGVKFDTSTAMDAKGDSVVTWVSATNTGSYNIHTRCFDPAGTPFSPEYQVNGFPGDTPAVAMDSVGNFVITWLRFGSDIVARRFNSACNPVSAEFSVPLTAPLNYQPANPSIAMNADGSFVVAWESHDLIGATALNIYAQRFNNLGAPLGSSFLVNTYTSDDQHEPSVSMDAAGNFVIAWQSNNQDGSSSGIYAQRYSADGAALGGEFRANTVTLGGQQFPTTAMAANGDFFIAWGGPEQTNQSQYGVHAQRYSASGAPIGSEFRVNTYTGSSQANPAAAMNPVGDLVISWESAEAGPHGGIYAQRYNAAGEPIHGEFQVSTFFNSNQRLPSVAMDSDGEFTVAWNTNDQNGSGYGIFAQRFRVNQAPTTLGIPDVIVNSDAPNTVIDLYPLFADSTDPSRALTYALVQDSNPALFSSIVINQSLFPIFALEYAPGQSGTATLTIRATDSGGLLFVDASFAVNVLAAPTVNTSNFQEQSSQDLDFTFSEDVHLSLSSADIIVQRLAPDPATIPVGEPVWDAATNTATFTFTGILPDGDYRATLIGSGINAGGAPMTSNTFLNFFKLNGDLNHDRSVSIADFIALASNFNKTNTTYADGDLNYDGIVSIADFLQLASNFNKTLATPPPATPQASASTEIAASKDRLRRHHHHRHSPHKPASRRSIASPLPRFFAGH